jgi:hypothetical protein
MGRAQLYSLNDSHPLAEAIVALFHEEHQRWDCLLTAMPEMLSKRGSAAASLDSVDILEPAEATSSKAPRRERK